MIGTGIPDTAAEPHIRGFHRGGEGVSFFDGPTDQQIRSALEFPEGVTWIDLTIATEADARILAEVMHFHPLTIEDVISDRHRPAKVDDHGDYIFIVVQAITDYTPGEEVQPVEVDFYLGGNFVVSCHREPVPAIDDFLIRAGQDPALAGHTPDWILHALLDAMVDELLPTVDAIDETIDLLESQVLEHADKAQLQDILMVKRNSLRLRRVTTPQREILNRLSRGEFATLINPDSAIYFRDVYDHLIRIEYLVEALRDLADGALQTYLSVVSNRLNEIMKALTVGATIFLPLTLVSGIYGMNFTHNQFPSFTSEWGFLVVVASMVIIATGLLIFFRMRRWI
jgi:magnesium transporter